MSQAKKDLSKEEVEEKVLGMLQEAKRIPRYKLSRERNALIDAIQYGHTQIAHSLLAHGVDPNSTDTKGRSALWYAAYWTKNSLIRDLVERGAKLPDDVLMGPTHHGDTETVRLLVQRGANVNCVASYTRYDLKFPQKVVLLSAAIQSARSKKSHAQIMDLPDEDWEVLPITLINAGAEVNRLAFTYSIYEGFTRTLLGLAAHCGQVKTVKVMLGAGADVNQLDTWGGNALFDVAYEGHLEVAKILIAAGIKRDVKWRDGATASSIAREKGFIELADLISS